jgi:hypothetical protein
MEVIIGSNTFKNTNAILKVQGKDQISLEVGKESGQLLLSMDVYDSAGKLVGKLVRNSWVFNDKDNYEITNNPKSLKLINKSTGATVVEASINNLDQIEISNGIFYTHRGHRLHIIPEAIILPGNTILSRNTIDGCGTAIAIG